MKQTISTEQEVENLLAILRQPNHVVTPNKTMYAQSIQKPPTKPIFRLNLIKRCLEVQRLTPDNEIFETSNFFTPQEVAQLASLERLKILSRYGTEIYWDTANFQFSHNGYVLITKDSVYKWLYGFYSESVPEKFVRGQTVFLKIDLHKQTYLYAQNLEDDTLFYLGHRLTQVQKNCFKVWLKDEWHVYFMNHISCYEICCGKEIFTEGDDMIQCLDFTGTLNTWKFQKRSPQKYLLSRVKNSCL